MKKLSFLLLPVIILAGCSSYLNQAVFNGFLQNESLSSYETENWQFQFNYPTKKDIKYQEAQTQDQELIRLNYHNGILSAFEIIVLSNDTPSEYQKLATTENFSFYLIPHNIPVEVENFVIDSFIASEPTIELEENKEL